VAESESPPRHKPSRLGAPKLKICLVSLAAWMVCFLSEIFLHGLLTLASFHYDLLAAVVFPIRGLEMSNRMRTPGANSTSSSTADHWHDSQSRQNGYFIFEEALRSSCLTWFYVLPCYRRSPRLCSRDITGAAPFPGLIF
jgi:hypothetical protein